MDRPPAADPRLRAAADGVPPRNVVLGLLYLGVAGGVVVLVRERRWPTLALVVVVVGCLAALAAGPAAESRFGVPMLPGLALGAGLGWERWLRPR